MPDSTETTETVVTDDPAPKPTETVEFWKGKAREQEKRAKDNAAAAKRLGEIEEAQKSEAQKAADIVADAKREVEQARTETMRYRIATEFQLSSEDTDALEHITSEEGMRQVAGRLSTMSEKRLTNGNVVTKEGTTSREPAEDELRTFTRELFGNAD